jgi:hypothetical protein
MRLERINSEKPIKVDEKHIANNRSFTERYLAAYDFLPQWFKGDWLIRPCYTMQSLVVFFSWEELGKLLQNPISFCEACDWLQHELKLQVAKMESFKLLARKPISASSKARPSGASATGSGATVLSQANSAPPPPPRKESEDSTQNRPQASLEGLQTLIAW